MPAGHSKKSEFIFAFTEEAANHKWSILEEYKRIFGLAIETQVLSQLSYGYNSRQRQLLSQFYTYSPSIPDSILPSPKGMVFPLNPSTSNKRRRTVGTSYMPSNRKIKNALSGMQSCQSQIQNCKLKIFSPLRPFYRSTKNQIIIDEYHEH